MQMDSHFVFTVSFIHRGVYGLSVQSSQCMIPPSPTSLTLYVFCKMADEGLL